MRARLKSHRPHPGLAALSLLGLLGIAILVLVVWLRNDRNSSIAAELRQMIGISLNAPSREADASGPAPAPRPEPPAPEPVVDTAPPEETRIADKATPEPVPETLAWRAFLDRPGLWPDSLRITFTAEVPILYRGTHFGSMFFEPGQQLEVVDLRPGRLILGVVNDMHILLPAASTDLAAWFRKTYESRYRLEQGDSALDAAQSENGERLNEAKMLREFRIWCYRNYESINFKITDEGIDFRWAEDSEILTDYRFEAHEIARKYLLIQAANGGSDNYAACRIFDPDSGELLGSGGIFMPELNLPQP